MCQEKEDRPTLLSEYESIFGGFASVSGMNLLVRSVGIPYDQSLHIDSFWNNGFLLYIMTNGYKLNVLPGGNHINWEGKSHLPTSLFEDGGHVQRHVCVAGERVKSLVLEEGSVFVAYDNTLHGGGSSSGSPVDACDNEYFYNLVHQNKMSNFKGYISDASLQVHVKLPFTKLTYNGKMCCSDNTETYTKVATVVGDSDIVKKTGQAIALHKEENMNKYREEQMTLFSNFEKFYEELCSCPTSRQPVMLRHGRLSTRASCLTTVLSPQIGMCSVSAKRIESCKKKSRT